MENTVKSVLKKTAGAACLALALGTAGLFGSAFANASSSHESNADVKVSTTPPEMKLATSAGEQVRSTGTQGIFDTADQCTSTSAAKTDCVTQSSEAAPQYRTK
jgi:hypothetical protein